MQQNRVKRIMREGGLALGTHLGGIPDPQIVESIPLPRGQVPSRHDRLHAMKVKSCAA